MIAASALVLLFSLSLANAQSCEIVLPTIAPITNSWPGGYSIQSVKIPFIINFLPIRSLQLTFSSPISSLKTWNALSTTTDNINFSLVNLRPGLGFNVTYPSTNTVIPVITKILVDGVTICDTPATPTVTSTTTKMSSSTIKLTTTTPTPTTNKLSTISTTKLTTKTPTPTTNKLSTISTTKLTTKTPTPTTKKLSTISTTKPPPSTTSKPSTTTPSKTTNTPLTTRILSTISTRLPTTSVPLRNCDAIAPKAFEYPGGFVIRSIALPSLITNWSIDITFSAAVSSLWPWNAKATTSDNIRFRLVSSTLNPVKLDFNGIGFNVNYPVSNLVANLTSILVNGIRIC